MKPEIKRVENRTFDEERALYHLCDGEVMNCVFDGPADGESALKEARNVRVGSCLFKLRYPFWHDTDFTVEDCELTDTARAPMWYCQNGTVKRTVINGTKCLRESKDFLFERVTGTSDEFGWRCADVALRDCDLTSVYFLFESRDLCVERLRFKGKYSFQYVRNVTIRDSVLDTKDAFWHAQNVTVRDSVVKGEYLGWYSDGLTLINCRISGTQPLCYCKNLKLIDCTMEGTDFAFEYSDVQADVKGEILSVKNPKSGRIVADGFGQIIKEDAVYPCDCRIERR